MALLPPKYLQSIVALGEMADPESREAPGEPMRNLATGFLYAYPRAEGQTHDGFRLWLVTCKHVILQPREENPDEIMVRLNKSGNQGMQTFRISLRQGEEPKWTLHPKADVAVIPASCSDLESKGVQWETFAEGRNALKRKDAIEVGLSEGDEVFVLGFPVGWRPGSQDYPIVRHGMLAQIQGWLRGEHHTFLVDGSGFPGNSGGPVVTKPQFRAVEGTRNVPRSWLVGMVCKRELSTQPVDLQIPSLLAWLVRMVRKIIPSPYALETADLIECVPMDLIDETVVLAMQREGSGGK